MDTQITHPYPRLRKYAPYIAAAAIVAALLAVALMKSGVTSYTADGENLIIADVIEGEFDDFIRLTGRVETATIVQVSATETGIVEEKCVEEGAMVNEGDIIITLSNPGLRQQILDSEAQLAEKQNMLRDTEIALEKERLLIRQDILTAAMELNRKRRSSERTTALFEEHLVSKEEYLTAREDYQLALENYNLLQNRRTQDSLYRSVQVAMMRESLRNMQENLNLVRGRADNLNIRAARSGQLGSLNAELGQNISTGQQVGQINILDSYKLAVSIDEHYIDRVIPGLRGIAPRKNGDVLLEIRKVYPEVTDGKFRADMILCGDIPENLRVGQTYNIDLTLSEPSEAILIPRGPFYQSTAGKWIYVLDPDGKKARKRMIKIDRQNPKYYEVSEGLKPGEKVVVSNYTNFGDVDWLDIE